MENGKFTVGTIIKGKDLKDCTLVKILADDMVMRDFQYHMGMNEDINPFARVGSCEAGLYFCSAEDICLYRNYGTKLAVVSIPDDEDVYVDEHKFRAHRLVIENVMHLKDVSTWEYLCGNGTDITAESNLAVRCAAEYGHLEVVKYLRKNGADITARENYAVRYAAENGHLEVVKYLHENGSNITALDNYVVRNAAMNGHLEVVKYLHENGADITADKNYAVRYAARNGHLEVVKYLHENGADITAKENYAVRYAAENGYLEVVKYLCKHGADITEVKN